MRTLEPYLAGHPFLEGLEPEYVNLIVGCASNVRFNAREYVFREGEEANRFFLIREGKVGLQVFAPGRGPITIQTIGKGGILGWSWLIPPYTWHFDAQAFDMTRAIALDGKCLRTKCDEDPHLGYEIMKRFAHVMEQNLQATRLQLLDVYRD